jgi:hypothetical protein
MTKHDRATKSTLTRLASLRGTVRPGRMPDNTMNAPLNTHDDSLGAIARRTH